MPSKCFCFDLKTASLLIGSIDLFLNVLFLIGGAVLYWREPVVLTLAVLATLLPIIAAIWLILGVKQDKPGYVVMWIILKAFALGLLLFALLAFLHSLFLGIGMGGGHGNGLTVLLVFVLLSIILFCLNVHWWFVVRSYQQELRARTAANFA